MARKRKPSTDRDAADEYFRRLVRARGRCIGFCSLCDGETMVGAGTCPRCHGSGECGETRHEKLQTCHVLSRKYAATRCDLENAVCGCGSCHARWGGDPPLFADVLRLEVGSEFNYDLDEWMAYLRERRDKGSDGICDELGIPKSHWWRHERERLKALCAAQGLETRL